MIIPSKCPICGDILINDFSFSNQSTKSCTKRLNHTFKMLFDDNDSLLIMHYRNVKNTKKYELDISWNFVEKRIFIGPYISIKGRSIGATTMAPGWKHTSITVIPWFEPDISNFPKLIKKIKTYICFS